MVGHFVLDFAHAVGKFVQAGEGELGFVHHGIGVVELGSCERWPTLMERAMETVPTSGITSPVRMRKSVVLPAPWGR